MWCGGGGGGEQEYRARCCTGCILSYLQLTALPHFANFPTDMLNQIVSKVQPVVAGTKKVSTAPVFMDRLLCMCVMLACMCVCVCVCVCVFICMCSCTFPLSWALDGNIRWHIRRGAEAVVWMVWHGGCGIGFVGQW